MEILHDYRDFPVTISTSITIGNFDGLHMGHREILKNLVAVARQSGTRSVVVTFSPHPLQILHPEKSPKSILLQEDKIEGIRELGVDYLLSLKFDQAFSEMSGEAFIRVVLVGSLHANLVLVGQNFIFGHKRSGNVALLQRLSHELSYVVEIIDPVEVRGNRVSSTWVRQLIESGKISTANRLLGRYYCISGTIGSGDGIGQKLLYPTLNLVPENEILPKIGVYVTRVTIQGKEYPAVTNIGVRPTVSGKTLRVETHLIQHRLENAPLTMKIEFLHRLRDEMKFPSTEALKEQIGKDVSRAIRFFKRLEHFRKNRLIDLKPS
jgi:riboflavin kinase / FMN adenylyltransferase